MVNIPGVENVNWLGWAGSIFAWVGWALLGLLLLGVMVLIYFYMQYKYKVVIRVMGHESKEGQRYVTDIKNDKLREIRVGGIVQKWKLLKTRKKIEPLALKYVLPKKYIFLDQISHDVFIPTPFAEIQNYDVTPQSIKLWEQNEIKQAAEEYQMKQGWEKYKEFAIAAVTVIACCIALMVTAYFVYKMVSMGHQDASSLISALSKYSDVPIGPH